LRAKFTGDPQYTVNFMTFIAQEVRELMAQLGFRKLEDMVGRTDMLEARKAVDHWKAKGLDFSNLLFRPKVGSEIGRFCTESQDHGIDKSLDITTLLPLCKDAIEKGEKVRADVPIRNINRTVGTILGNEITKRHWHGLPDDTVHLHFRGSAGQSFGAFVPKGVTLELEGDGNDYIGKGLSGGKIMVFPPREATFVAEENILIGNVALYGATSGEAYFRGMGGERFCVRNSGAEAVVEGVGDHGCEYMTGGRAIIIGGTGRNFAAGMSGGIAFVFDPHNRLPGRCNTDMVDLDRLESEEDEACVQRLLANHVRYTKSPVAERILRDWATTRTQFVKVMPRDYKHVLAAIARARAAGLPEDEAVMEASHG
jgi:glutamate synthase (ferredoxin)